MKKIPVSDLTAGIRFSKPVYLDKETVFAAPDQPLTQQDLDRLNQFKISFVLTDGEPVQNKAGEISAKESDLGSTHGNLPLFKNDDFSRSCKEILDKAQEERQNFMRLWTESVESTQKAYRLTAEGKVPEIRDFRELAERLSDHCKTNIHLPILLFSVPASGYYLYNHVAFSTFLSIYIGIILEFSRPKLIDLAIAAFFADLGMTSIPEEVSEKRGALNEMEWKTIKKHPIVGYQLLTQKLKLKNSLALVALQHHEASDGSGYPQKFVGSQIEELTKVYSIADHFAAMVFARPHRPAYMPYEAMRILISENVAKYDLKTVRLFLNKLSMFPVGSAVQLSDGRIGMVILANKDKPLRPIVRITKEVNGKKAKVLEFIDLMKDLNLFIAKAVPNSDLF